MPLFGNENGNGNSNCKNHPAKGSSIFVEPIRNIGDVLAIRNILRNTCLRDDLLFTMGINNSLRIGDLLQLRTEDIKKMNPGDHLEIVEQKTGKKNILIVNRVVHNAIISYFQNMNGKAADSVYLFQSRKGAEPLSIAAVNGMVKQWTAAINLPGNYGGQTLRKTWGYHQKTRFGVSFKVLCKRFNHDLPSTTMKYLGFSSENIDYLLIKNELGVITHR